MAYPPFEVVRGALFRKRITALTTRGDPITSFADADVLSAEVWAGDDEGVLFRPSVAWIDAGTATFRLSINPSGTATIDPGTYRLQIFVVPASDGVRRILLDGSMKILTTAGSGGSPGPVYATYEDLLDYCPRVDRVQDDETDRAGFAEQRARARAWFDDEILRMYHPQPGRTRRMVDLAGTGAGPYVRFAEPPEDAAIPSDDELRAILDADGLAVTDMIRECVSHKAAALIYRNAAGPYADDAARHDGLARQMWWRIVPEVKSDPDLDEPDLRVGRDIIFLT